LPHRQKDGIKEQIIKVSIQYKVQPRVAQYKTRVHVKGCYVGDAGMVSGRKGNCHQHLDSQQNLLRLERSEPTVVTDPIIQIVDFWQQQSQGFRSDWLLCAVMNKQMKIEKSDSIGFHNPIHSSSNQI